jgi:hypothetical protein
MSKDIKKVIIFASIIDYKYLGKYFEKMASKGWMISEIGKVNYIFRSIEPRKLDFDVSLLYENTSFDYPDDTNYRDFESLCRESGWELCLKNNIYQIFWKEKDTEALPIHTDSSEEFRIVKSVYLRTEFFTIILFGYLMIMGFNNVRNFNYEDILSNLSIFSLVFPFIVGLMFLTMVLPAVIWFTINRRNAREGSELYYFSDRIVKVKITAYMLFLIIYISIFLFAVIDNFTDGYIMLIAFIPAVLGIVVGKYCVKRFKSVKRTRKQNKIFFLIVTSITIVISINAVMFFVISTNGDSYDGVPEKGNVYLQLSDFNPDAVVGRSNGRNKSSILVENYLYYYETLFRKPSKDELYSVETIYIECKNKKIADYIFNGYMEEKEERFYKYGDGEESDIEFVDSIVPIDTNRWKVDKGFYLQEDNSEVIIQSGNIVYILESDVDFSDENIIEICRNKMNI